MNELTAISIGFYIAITICVSYVCLRLGIKSAQKRADINNEITILYCKAANAKSIDELNTVLDEAEKFGLTRTLGIVAYVQGRKDGRPC